MGKKIICDSVHGIMSFKNSIYEELAKVINSRYFQRLRQIKQLSFAEFAYPGAVHNRFSHSIGTAYLSTLVYTTVYSDSKEDNADMVALAITALIHDIGHGPFSHTFEQIFNEALKTNKICDSNTAKIMEVNHEDWSNIYIDKLINEDLISSTYGKLVQQIYRDEKHKLHGIISSQLDVDRFDYLLRDSHFCGVSYGHFDLYWLIDCLRLCKMDNVICIEEKGINALEHYIMARRLMNKNVYFHRIKCAYEFMLSIFFRLINKYITEISRISQIEHFPLVRLLSNVPKNQTLTKQEILNNLFNYYNDTSDYDIWSLVKQISNINNSDISLSEIKLLKSLCGSLLNRQLPDIYTVRIGYSTLIKNKMVEFNRNSTSNLTKYVLEFDHKDFGVYKTKGEEIFYLTGDDYRNVLAKSSLLKTTQTEEVRYLYKINIDDIDSSLNKELDTYLNSLSKYLDYKK